MGLRLQGELDVLRMATLSDEYLTKELHGLHARWPKIEQGERRQIIEQNRHGHVRGSWANFHKVLSFASF